MSSSSGEEPRTSPIVADATPMVNMEAKMVVATGRDHCHQLKDMLNKADPSTMVVVMASGNQTSTPKPRLPVMDPRLLAAAFSGSFQDLESLLNGEDCRALSDGAIGSSARQPASGDEEAFLRESLLDMVTIGGDTALHVVAATNGDCADSLNKAGLVHRKAKNLLFVQNNKGDTPLHCAAREGRFQMVSLLTDLAKGQDTNASRMKTLLEAQNKNKWTALHEAVLIGNSDIVKWLMTKDPEVANIPRDGISPLYLAILLQRKSIAKTHYELSVGVISYSGPNGQNALHAAVVRDKGLTEMVLGWNNGLKTQQDDKGSTPLHLVASVMRLFDRRRDIRLLLLEANPDALYQMDNDGSFPIHVAASVGARTTISDFLQKSPSCAGLRDARGRTFLHVAVDKMKIWPVWSAYRNQSLSWILNMQDSDGNTALHLAVQNGALMIFCALVANRQVHLNLTNEKGETPLDIADRNISKGLLYYNQNSEVQICRVLILAGAKRGICRQDYVEENNIIHARQGGTHKMDQVKEGTQNLCVGSALVATVTFGASFAIPGGYRADDHTNGGTPTLAGRYAFDAFTLANAFAFASSVMATVSLMYSGSPLINLGRRGMHIAMAYSLMVFSFANVTAAFALGTYTMLAPVASKTAVAACAPSSLVLVYNNLELAMQNSVLNAALCWRMGIPFRIVWTFMVAAFVFVVTILFNLWPIVILFSLTALSHTGGKVELVAQPPTPLA